MEIRRTTTRIDVRLRIIAAVYRCEDAPAATEDRVLFTEQVATLLTPKIDNVDSILMELINFGQWVVKSSNEQPQFYI